MRRALVALGALAALGALGACTRASTQPASTKPAPAPVVAATLHCFQWTHGREFSTDCYRGGDACERAREDMLDGGRGVTPCALLEHGSCTLIARPEVAAAPEERCFGDANNCERYRAFVLGNRFTASACAEPR